MISNCTSGRSYSRDLTSNPLRGSVSLLVALCLLSATGCAALHPIHGIPVKYISPELRGAPRSGKQTIDLSRLGQPTPAEYLLDTGDVLAIYIEGILGKREEVPPVFFPTLGDAPPTLGFPIPVRDDGTISLPLIPPIMVRGLTVRRFEEAIRKAYLETDNEILARGNTRILVSLQRPRSYQVLVLRQESVANAPAMAMFGTVNLGNAKRGTGQLVTLPAYKNDVLHALTQTGGLPGLDAQNAIYILRRGPAKLPLLPNFNPLLPLPSAANRSSLSPVSLASGMESGGISTGSIQQVAAFQRAPDSYGFSPAPATGVDYRTALGHSLPKSPNVAIAPVSQATVPFETWSSPYSAQTPLSPQMQFSPPMQMSPPIHPYGAVPPTRAWQMPVPPAETVYNPPTVERMPPAINGLNSINGASCPQLPPELQAYGPGTQIIRIPIRLGPLDRADFNPSDVILYDNDIVFIESRETEIFYTGGLLGGGQYMLPRDYDLDVLGAISIASGRQASANGSGFGNRIGGISAINQDISVSASQVIILRQTPDGNQVPILVCIPRAMRDPQERILIQPGDYLILQYTRLEAIAAFVERNILAGSLIGLATTQQTSKGN